MSSIKLSPNASGSGAFTIAAPNSNTDQTLTLPNVTGTLVTNSGSEAASFASLAVSGASTTGSLAVNSNNISAVNSLGFRNRIIDGDMRIDQRNAGASVTVNGGTSPYVVDRFIVGLFGSTYSSPATTAQQVTDAPSGFSNSLKVTSSSTITPDANKLGSWFEQKIEGFNIADLAWGTASAVSVTVSFRVKASKTGTVSVSIENSATDRSYLTTVTISAANTWETKSVTIPGDTTGTWLTNNSMGLSLKIGIMSNGSWLAGTGGSWSSTRVLLSSSQTNFIAASGDNIAITGVQLEAGTVASPFERRPYGEMLMLCQRYYIRFPTAFWGTGIADGGRTWSVMVQLPVSMRAQPSVTNSSDTSGIAANGGLYSLDAASASIPNSWWNGSNGLINVTTGTQITQYTIASGRVANLQCNAEL